MLSLSSACARHLRGRDEHEERGSFFWVFEDNLGQCSQFKDNMVTEVYSSEQYKNRNAKKASDETVPLSRIRSDGSPWYLGTNLLLAFVFPSNIGIHSLIFVILSTMGKAKTAASAFALGCKRSALKQSDIVNGDPVLKTLQPAVQKNYDKIMAFWLE